MAIIDAHIHYADTDPGLLSLMEDFDLKFLNICVARDAQGEWRQQADAYRQVADAYPNRFAWCTSFDLPRFDDPDYVQKVIDGLDADFASGAIACKVWKNLGMEVRKPDGTFFMVDDPLLDPIFDHVAKAGRTLLMHIGEPLICWQPLEMHSPHSQYYRNNPEWHMYNKPEYPHHSQLIEARDQVVEKHPDLRIVGAHFGSLEYDLDEIAARLKRYPNFVVDISARLGDLAIKDPDKVREFVIEYANRILWGTDVVMRDKPSSLPEAEREQALANLRKTFETYTSYFESTAMVEVRGETARGLGLPTDILEQLYYSNAKAWYPGI
jgi:predicted TIM-barrel fold metal-dependent hydrolase